MIECRSPRSLGLGKEIYCGFSFVVSMLFMFTRVSVRLYFVLNYCSLRRN